MNESNSYSVKNDDGGGDGPDCWTVGHYSGTLWITESVHKNHQEASLEATRLNGAKVKEYLQNFLKVETELKRGNSYSGHATCDEVTVKILLEGEEITRSNFLV